MSEPKLGPKTRRALRDVQAALARHEAADRERFLGRWLVVKPEHRIRVVQLDHAGDRALLSDGTRRWWAPLRWLRYMADRHLMVWRGRS